MPHGVHKTVQTAFRIPEAVLARLKESAGIRGETMTDIVVRGTVAELDRLDGITTRVTTTPEPAGNVSPPPKGPRKPRVEHQPVADTAPPVVLREPCAHPKARIQKGLCANCGTYVGTTKGS
jgi:hypothetical protein